MKTLEPTARKTAKTIFEVLTAKWPELTYEIAWNQPMLRLGKTPVFGLSAARNHLTLTSFSADQMEAFAAKLKKYEVNKEDVPSAARLES